MEAVKVLLEVYPDGLVKKDGQGLLPIHYGVVNHQTDMVQLFLQDKNFAEVFGSSYSSVPPLPPGHGNGFGNGLGNGLGTGLGNGLGTGLDIGLGNEIGQIGQAGVIGGSGGRGGGRAQGRRQSVNQGSMAKMPSLGSMGLGLDLGMRP